MADPEDFAKWAAAFMQQYQSAGEPGTAGVPPDAAPKYAGVTAEASLLLESVDQGGVPAFVTQALLKIARDNGVVADAYSKPNEIIAALRRLAAANPPAVD